MHEDVRQLHAELTDLIAAERKGLVAFLRTLDRFEAEGGPARFACGSLFLYLEQRLHLAAGSAWRRTRALQLLRAFPGLAAPLEDGRLNLTTVEILGRVATGENVDELVDRFAWKTKREAEEIEVATKPRPAPMDGVRKLPERPAPALTLGSPPELPPAEVHPGTVSPATSAPPSMPMAATPSSAPFSLRPSFPERSEPRAVVEPVAKGRWSLRVTLGTEGKAMLDRLRDLLSHKVPDGDLQAVLEEALACAIEKHGKRRGTVKPQRARKEAELPEPTPGQRAPIKAWVRREVMERDGHRCVYMSPDGARCQSTWQLELHHRNGALVTGSSTPEELEVRCKAHNMLDARDVFGKEHLERRIRDARHRRGNASAARTTRLRGPRARPRSDGS